MKKKLTLSVEENLIKTAKVKAIQFDCSVSELFEEYIKAIQKNKQVIDLIKKVQNTLKVIIQNIQFIMY